MGCSVSAPATILPFTVSGPSVFITSGQGPYSSKVYFIDTAGERHFIGDADPFLEVTVPGNYEVELSSSCGATPSVTLEPIGSGGSGVTPGEPPPILTERPVCVISGADLIDAFIISEVSAQGTTVLRMEDANGNPVSGDLYDCRCSCPLPVDRCVFIKGFDYFAIDSLEQEEVMMFDISIDGVLQTTLTLNYLITNDGVNKSSWYTPLVSYINSMHGFSMDLNTDVSITDDTNRPIWLIKYAGATPVELKIRKYNESSDTYTMSFTESGVATSAFDDTNELTFGSEMFFPCENDTAVPVSCTQLRAFDFLEERDLDANGLMEFRVFLNGNITSIIVHNYLDTADGVGKGSWYQPLVDAVNATGWKMQLIGDVQNNSQQRPLWKITYSGNSSSTLEISKDYVGSQNPDKYIIIANGIGGISTLTVDGTQLPTEIPFGTDPWRQCNYAGGPVH